jgi:hypothetical protein
VAPNESPDLWLQSPPASHQRMKAWQTKGDHLCEDGLWEMQGATLGEDDPQAQSVPEYEFDQRVAW